MNVEICGLVKRFGDVVAADDVSLEVKSGSTLSLLGPSGCGKTTVLRCIAGLERPDKGEISIDGQIMSSTDNNIFVAPQKRNLGMVFQSYAIWPHMTVYDNIAHGLRVRNVKKDEIKRRVIDMLRFVDLEVEATRYPHQLSGGQQQRVALARSLVYEPKVLLLDEPLSNLDAKLREKARFWLKDLQDKLDITSIYVTHDQAEAMIISKEIAVMNKGKIMQIGKPEEIYGSPTSTFVADFVGKANFLPVANIELMKGRDDSYKVRLENVCMHSTGEFCCVSDFECSEKQEFVVFIRPNQIVLHKDTPHQKMNVLEGLIRHKIYAGRFYRYSISVGESDIQVQVESKLDFPEDSKVYLFFPPEFCKLIAKV